MRKIVFTGFLTLFFVAGVTAQNATSILPQNARDFIDQHFENAQVTEVDKEDGWFDWDRNEMYEVHFRNGIKLDFDRNGEVTEIDSKSGEVIPMEALPGSIRSYIEENYRGKQVVSWEKDRNDQEVSFTDGTELEFDSQGNFRKLD